MGANGRYTVEEARAFGEAIGIAWDRSPFDVEQFRAGMEVELEHGAHDPQTDVTGNNPIPTAKIAWAHLKEFPDYYTRLARMEADAKAALVGRRPPGPDRAAVAAMLAPVATG